MFFATAVAFLLLSFFIDNKEAKNTVRILGLTLIGAMFIFNLFKSSFGHKPTLQEIEDAVFGKESKKAV